MKEEKRCPWCLSSPGMIRYHDEEWGRANATMTGHCLSF